MVNLRAPQSEHGTPLQTRVEASLDTDSVIAQLTAHKMAVPGDFVLLEDLHTLALQRQMQDSFSVGRFETEGAYRDFVDIGRVLFVPAGVPLRIRSDGQLTRTFRCFFKPGMFAALADTNKQETLPRLHNCLNITSRLIRTLALRMAEELETPGLASVELIDALGTSLQIEVARYILDSPSHLDTSRGGLTRGAYRKIIARIEADAPPPTLEQLASLAGLSKRHLTRAFRESTGLTVAQMIDESRYKRGVNLLRNPDIRIAEISTRLGFRSSASFSRAFRRWSGQSPRRFRHSQKVSLEDGKQLAARPERDGPPAE